MAEQDGQEQDNVFRKYSKQIWRLGVEQWIHALCNKVLLSSYHFVVMFPTSAFSTRLFAVLRFESVIHEFDPYFNFRTTKFLTREGFYQFHNWFDDRAWYPLGRIIGGTIYPGTASPTEATFH